MQSGRSAFTKNTAFNWSAGKKKNGCSENTGQFLIVRLKLQWYWPIRHGVRGSNEERTRVPRVPILRPGFRLTFPQTGLLAKHLPEFCKAFETHNLKVVAGD